MRTAKRIQILVAGAALLAAASMVQMSVDVTQSEDTPVQAEHALLSGPEATQDQLDQNAPPSVLVLQHQDSLQYSAAKLWLI